MKSIDMKDKSVVLNQFKQLMSLKYSNKTPLP